MKKTTLISLHGGHSGEFCTHAKDRLEDIIKKYIELGFKTVGITEHVPPCEDRFRYPDEIQKGQSAEFLYDRFRKYAETLKGLQKKYYSKLKIYFGMETETWAGYIPHVRNLVNTFQPDYIVGSVHHLDDICFDYSKQAYERVIKKCGSIDAMYNIYFDLQFEMIKALKPFVVGHFDLIRIFDNQYKKRVLKPQIHKKIIRNLELIKKFDLVLDLNLRSILKGADEPYVTASILKLAKNMGIRAVPGDDAHSVFDAGLNIEKGIKILKAAGFDLDWPEPRLI